MPTPHEIAIELLALEKFNAHYAARPHITERDYSSIEFYRRMAADQMNGATHDHEALRKAYGGSFE